MVLPITCRIVMESIFGDYSLNQKSNIFEIYQAFFNISTFNKAPVAGKDLRFTLNLSKWIRYCNQNKRTVGAMEFNAESHCYSKSCILKTEEII